MMPPRLVPIDEAKTIGLMDHKAAFKSSVFVEELERDLRAFSAVWSRG